MSLGLMTPYHARWNEFIVRLEGPEEGCNFRETSNGALLTVCDSQDLAKPKCRAILRKMGATDIEIEQTIGFFTGSGGYCDCEVALNVGMDHARRGRARHKNPHKTPHRRAAGFFR